MTSTIESKLLSGGNTQIAKGYGDKPVQTYIAAMPGWKAISADALMQALSGSCRGSARP